MSSFDDRDLRDALRRRAGAPTDELGLEAARSAVVARAARVRRRRAVVAGGAAMAGLVAVAVLVIGREPDSVVTTPADGTDVSVPASVDSSVDASTPADPDRTVADTTTPASPASNPATTVPSGATATTTPAVAPATTAAPPPSTPATTPATTTPGSTTPAEPQPFTETYTSAGGSITVRFDGAALNLEDVAAADGFDPEVEDERADRIRVRFRGDSGDVRIEIRLQDGQVVRVE
ncbi:MAG: hypothetical protein ACRDZZ_05465 [Ilumatobacteraceae bacterium]